MRRYHANKYLGVLEPEYSHSGTLVYAQRTKPHLEKQLYHSYVFIALFQASEDILEFK